MGQGVDHQHGTYRCPVCGHRDIAELPLDLIWARIACTYCETPLEVRSRGLDSVRFAVRVAEAPATR